MVTSAFPFTHDEIKYTAKLLTIWVSPLVNTPTTSWVVVFVLRETAATFVPTYDDKSEIT